MNLQGDGTHLFHNNTKFLSHYNQKDSTEIH
jgi:hypothetical protein